MPLSSATRDRLARLVESTITPAHAERVRRTENALTEDGKVRASQLIEQVPEPARWPVEPSGVAVPGFDYDTLDDLLVALQAAIDALPTDYLATASPTFTGTLTGPSAAFGADLAVNGNTTLGNADTDAVTVNATATFASPTIVNDILTLGDSFDHNGTTFGALGVTPATQRPANADTSGATLAQLETEVNEIKVLLRTFGFLAP